MRPQIKIVGIVNITEDSFSDGGQYFLPEEAITRATTLIAGGAEIVDIGPAASHPGARPISSAEEIRRLQPVLESLLRMNVSISVDSCQPETQLYALSKGVDFLNDIHGFAQTHIYTQIAEAKCKLIVMHSLHGSQPLARLDIAANEVWERLIGFLTNRITILEDHGIARDRIIIDPGMGFFLGFQPEASLHVLANLRELKRIFDLPILVSVSRKSFLRTITGSDLNGIGPATLAAELFASIAGVDYIRTHEPRPLKDALCILKAIEDNTEARDLRTNSPWPRQHRGS